MNNKLKNCPVCNGELIITEYKCPACDTSIKGKFSTSDFGSLNSTQLDFVKTFLCAEGNIKEVGRMLKISYPTVKNRLSEITSILCPDKGDEKLSLLSKIENGELSVEDAIKKLKG